MKKISTTTILVIALLAACDVRPQSVAVKDLDISFIVPKGWNYVPGSSTTVRLRPKNTESGPHQACTITRNEPPERARSSTQVEINKWFDANPITDESFARYISANTGVPTRGIRSGKTQVDDALAYWMETESILSSQSSDRLYYRGMYVIAITPLGDWRINCAVASPDSPDNAARFFEELRPTMDRFISSIRFRT